MIRPRRQVKQRERNGDIEGGRGGNPPLFSGAQFVARGGHVSHRGTPVFFYFFYFYYLFVCFLFRFFCIFF